MRTSNGGLDRKASLPGIEQAILAKLAEYGVSLTDSDNELRRAFAGTVAPTKCFHIAKLMQARVGCTA